MLAKFAAIVLRKDILGTIVPMTMIASGTYNTPKIVMIMLNSTTKKTGATMLKNLIRMNLLNVPNVVMMHSGKEVIMNVNNADGVDYLMTIDTHCNSGEDFPKGQRDRYIGSLFRGDVPVQNVKVGSINYISLRNYLSGL